MNLYRQLVPKTLRTQIRNSQDIFNDLKCFKKMEEFKKSKDITIIFVSHGLGQVESFCTRAIYINNHHLQYDGSPKTAVEKYTNHQTGQTVS